MKGVSKIEHLNKKIFNKTKTFFKIACKWEKMLFPLIKPVSNALCSGRVGCNMHLCVFIHLYDRNFNATSTSWLQLLHTCSFVNFIVVLFYCELKTYCKCSFWNRIFSQYFQHIWHLLLHRELSFSLRPTFFLYIIPFPLPDYCMLLCSKHQVFYFCKLKHFPPKSNYVCVVMVIYMIS